MQGGPSIPSSTMPRLRDGGGVESAPRGERRARARGSPRRSSTGSSRIRIPRSYSALPAARRGRCLKPSSDCSAFHSWTSPWTRTERSASRAIRRVAHAEGVGDDALGARPVEGVPGPLDELDEPSSFSAPLGRPQSRGTPQLLGRGAQDLVARVDRETEVVERGPEPLEEQGPAIGVATATGAVRSPARRRCEDRDLLCCDLGRSRDQQLEDGQVPSERRRGPRRPRSRPRTPRRR